AVCQRRRRTGPVIASGARLGIGWPVLCGRPRYGGQATCVLDPVHCERPDGRRNNSSEPDCGGMSRGVHSSPADHRPEEKKVFCRVPTRGRKIPLLNGLGRDLGSSPALPFRLGMARSSRSVLPTHGLAPCRLPATDFPPTLRVVTVALVPTRRQILTIT